MSERPSFPPGIEGLKASTEQYRKHLDRIEPGLKDIALPAAVAIAALDLTDEQRLAAARELWKLHRKLGNTHMDQTLHTFEREARERMAKGAEQ